MACKDLSTLYVMFEYYKSCHLFIVLEQLFCFSFPKFMNLTFMILYSNIIVRHQIVLFDT